MNQNIDYGSGAIMPDNIGELGLFCTYGCLRFYQLPLILTLTTLCLFPPVFGEEATTLGAGLGEGLIIGGKGAFRVIATAIEGALLFTYSLHQLTATFGAANTNLNLKGPGVFVLGVMATGEKLPKTPGLDYYRLATLRAGFIGYFIGQFYFLHK